LGAKFLVVLCAGSTFLLVQSKALDEAPYKLSGAVAKLAYITFRRLDFSWTKKPWFLTEGKFATVLIIPSYWGSQLDGEITSTPPQAARPPWSTPNDAPSPIRSLGTENPKTIGKFPERVLQLRRR
jgi:hypothetical protein